VNVSEPCRLCNEARPLRLSHINPKFVFRFQRDASITAIRSHLTPYRPAQDSRKIRFLCGECEERFNRWETAFKREVYDPYHTGTLSTLLYGSWLLKFAASLSWRALRATLESGDPTPAEVQSASVDAEIAWRHFLLDRKEHPGRFHQYLFLLRPLEQLSDPILPTNFASYVQLGAATGIWHAPRRHLTVAYCLMCSVIVVGIVSARNVRGWGERLRVRGGTLRSNGQMPPLDVVEMIRSQARDHLEMESQIPERQKILDRKRLIAAD